LAGFFWQLWRMIDSQVQDITATDAAPTTPLGKTLLALNNAHAQELSWLEPERLQHLVGQAFLARRIGNLDAFLLAFDQDADYDSPNFLWFRARYPRFVYVDRVVVASSARGRGCARRLYDELFAHAGSAGHERIVCEVNKSPPNPASDALHAALGFVEVGSADVHGGSKTVRYLSRMLSQAAVAGGSASTE
jgi:predicted GNAT superfamily acetyltransferase